MTGAGREAKIKLTGQSAGNRGHSGRWADGFQKGFTARQRGNMAVVAVMKFPPWFG